MKTLRKIKTVVFEIFAIFQTFWTPCIEASANL